MDMFDESGGLSKTVGVIKLQLFENLIAAGLGGFINRCVLYFL